MKKLSVKKDKTGSEFICGEDTGVYRPHLHKEIHPCLGLKRKGVEGKGGKRGERGRAWRERGMRNVKVSFP